MAFQDVMQNLQLVDIFYPPGSYYETSDPDFDPNVRWGGIWEKEVVVNDQVVEEGIDGIWHYRKWSSGIAECWGIRDTTTAAFVDWSNLARGYVSATSFPTGLFSTTPTITMKSQSTSNAIMVEGNAHGSYGGGLPSKTSTGGMTLYSGDKSAYINNSFQITVRYYAIGLWKTYTAPTIVYVWHRMSSYLDVDLTQHGSWIDSGTEVDGHKVYKSESSYHVQNAWDTAKIIFKGFRKFQIAIRSYAEGSYDYVLVSTLNNDYLATQANTSAMRNAYNNAEYTKAYTRSKQSATNYEIVTFDNLNKNQEYYFYVIYQKDSSTDSNDDRGYFYIITE